MRLQRFTTTLLIVCVPLGILTVGTVRLVQRVWSFLNTDARLAVIVSQEATRALGREVKVGGVKLTGNLWGLSAENRVELSDVAVAEGKTLREGAFASADKILFHYNLNQLLLVSDNNVPRIETVQLVHPNLSLKRDKTGHWNFEQLIKPSTGGGRPFAEMLSMTDGTLQYSDADLPRPAGVPYRVLQTRFDHINGALAIRTDKGIAFEANGIGEPRLAGTFHAEGVVEPVSRRVEVHVQAAGINAPAVAPFALAPQNLRLSNGKGDLEFSLLAFLNDPKAKPTDPRPPVTFRAELQLDELAGSGRFLGAAVRSVNGKLTVTNEMILANVRGLYANTPVTLDLQLFGLGKPAAEVTVAAQGVVPQGDIGRVLRDLPAERLASLSPRVRAQLRRLYGVGSASFQLVGTLDNPAATLIAHLDTAQYDRYKASNLDINARYADHLLTADARAIVANGFVTLRGQYHNDSQGAYHAEARGRNIQLQALGLNLKQKISGTGQVDAVVRGSLKTTPLISAQAQVLNGKIDKQPVRSLYARAQSEGNRLVIPIVRAEAAGSLAVASGAVNLKTKALNLNVEADGLDIGTLMTLFRPASPGVVYHPELALDNRDPLGSVLSVDPNLVTGIGYIRGQVNGTVSDPRFQGRLTALALEYRNLGLDKVAADVTATRKLVRISGGEAQRYLGKIFFNGEVNDPLSSDPYLRMTTSVQRLDVADLLFLAGQETEQFTLTGNLFTNPIRAEGPLSDIQVTRPFTAELRNASLNGEPLRNVSLTARYVGQELEIVNAGLQYAEGALTASGTVGKDGTLDLKVHGSQFNLDTLTNLLPGDFALRVNGALALDASVTGTVKAPIVTAQATATDLALNNVALGELHADARYADNRLAVADLTLDANPNAPQAQIKVSGLNYNRESDQINGSLAWNDLPIQQLRELVQVSLDPDTESGRKILDTLRRVANPIEGLTSGTVQLSGTTKKPETEIAWNITGAHINDYPTFSLIGNARINRERVLIPQARLESAQGNLEIDANNVKVEYEGDIAGDLTAYNVDLGFLQSLLPQPTVRPSEQVVQDAAKKTDTRRLRGVGDFGLSASGKRVAPEFRVSVNLRDVAYADPALLPTPAPTPQGQTSARPYSDQTIDHIDLYDATLKYDASTDKGVFAGSLRIVKKGFVNGKPADFDLTANGSLGFIGQSPFIPDDAKLDFQTGVENHPEITLPLDSITLLAKVFSLNSSPNATRATNLRDLFQGSEGSVAVTARVTGTRKTPVFTGALSVEAPRFQAFGLSTGLVGVRGVLNLDNDKITVAPGFQARTQVFGKGVPDPKLTGSPIQLTGSLPIGLGDVQPNPGGGIKLRADRVVFQESPLPGAKTGSARGIAEVQLQVTGTAKEPTLGGIISVRDATAALPSEFGGLASSDERPLLDPHFALQVLFDRNVHLTNPQLNALIAGAVNIDGSLSNIQLAGNLTFQGGQLSIPTAPRFTILPPGSLNLRYPVYDSVYNTPTLGIDVNLRAQTFLTATSYLGSSRRYRITVTARGPLTGANVDPLTGRSRLILDFQSDPPDLAVNQQALNDRLTGLLIGADAFNQFGRNPGQALASQLTNAFTNSVLPGLFGNLALRSGFEELSLGYNAQQGVNLAISRQIVGPLYISYIRSLSGLDALNTFRASLRFRNRFQLSYETNEQREQRIFLEGIWRF